MKILLIDDDEKLCRLIRGYLEPMGFAVEVAHSGQVGLELALQGLFDAILLDVMLPEIDGFEVLRQLRQHSKVPVLMFTARGDETDRIVGLEMGLFPIGESMAEQLTAQDNRFFIYRTSYY